MKNEDKAAGVTPAMIEAGIGVIRDAFGGQTEGNNRFVDFEEVAIKILSLRHPR